jgi:hypothetical protein
MRVESLKIDGIRSSSARNKQDRLWLLLALALGAHSC